MIGRTCGSIYFLAAKVKKWEKLAIFRYMCCRSILCAMKIFQNKELIFLFSTTQNTGNFSQLFVDEMLCAVVFCCLLFCCCVVICVVFCFVSIADNPFTLHFKTTYGTGNVNFHIQFHNFNPNSVIFKMQTLLHTTKQPKFPNLHPSCFSIRNCKAMAASTMTGGSVSSVKQIRAEFTAVARFLSSLKVMSPKLCNTQHA